MVVFDDLASRVELSEMSVVGKRVALAKNGSLKHNQHEDLAPAVEDRMRFEAMDLKRCHSLEEPRNIRFSSACFQPQHV